MRADRLTFALVCIGALACARLGRAPQPAAVAPLPEPLPPLAVDQLSTPPVLTVTPEPGTIARREPRVTLTAADADVRELLPILAEAGGISLVVGPEVTGRVSIRFEEVPVSQAIEAVLREAGLSAARDQGIRTPWNGPVLFYELKVNIDSLDADAIRRQFSVSPELAQWMVEARTAVP